MTKSDDLLLPENGYEFAVIRAMSNRYSEAETKVLRDALAIVRMASTVLSAIDRHFSELGISQGRFAVLLLLSFEPETAASPSRLAELCGVSRAAMTGLLDGLENSGFVARAAHSTDRRALIVKLTDSGREFLDSAIPKDRRRLSDLMDSVSESERQRLTKAAGRISEIFSRWIE